MIANVSNEYLLDFNNWLRANSIPLSLPFFPMSALKGNALNQYISEKSHKGKLWLSATTVLPFKNSHYPVLTIVSHAHGGEKLTYSGLDLARNLDENSGYKKEYDAPAPMPVKSQDDNGAAWFAKVENWYSKGKQASPLHPYLVKKNIIEFHYLFKEIKQHDKYWLIAKANDDLYQLIDQDGNKLFAGSQKGKYLLIGNPDKQDDAVKTFYVAEGIATGCSIIDLTCNRRTVAIAFNAGNLLPVAQSLRAAYPDCKLIFCADNDDRLDDDNTDSVDRNVGLRFAIEAAKMSGENCKVVMPYYLGFKTDFNDFAKTERLTDELLAKCEYPIITALDCEGKDLNKCLDVLTYCALYLSDKNIIAQFSKYFLKFNLFQDDLLQIKDINYAFYNYLVEKLSKKKVDIETALDGGFRIEPTIINSDYLPEINWEFGTEKNPRLYLIKSPLGSGKTTQLKSLIETAKRLKMRLVYIVPRKILSANMSRQLGIDDYQTVKAPRDSAYVSLVINSVGLITDDTREIVIIDESEQVFKQIVSNIISDKKEVIQSIDSLLMRAKTIVCLDAHLSSPITESFVTAALRRVDRQPRATFIKNESKRFANRDMFLYAKESELLAKAAELLQQGKKLFIATNGIKKTYIIKHALKAACNDAKVFVLNSDNSQGNEAVEFVFNINEKIQDVDVLITSPSLTSGVSIDDVQQHFDCVLGFFNSNTGCGDALDAMQQIARVRYTRECHVWYENNFYSLPIEPEKIIKGIKGMQAYVESYNGISAEFHPYVNLFVESKTVSNLLRQTAKMSFIYLAEKDGWNVKGIVGNAELGAALEKPAKESFKKEEIAGVIEARPLSDKEAVDLKERIKSREDRHAIERHEIEAFYAIPITDELIEQDSEGKTRQAIMLRELIASDDNYLVESDNKKYGFLSQNGATPHFVPKQFRKEYYRVCLSVYTQDNVMPSDDAVTNAIHWIQDNKEKLQACDVNVVIPYHNPMQFFGSAVKRLGYQTKRTQRTVNGKRVSCYTLVRNDFIESVLIARREKNKRANESVAIPKDDGLTPEGIDQMMNDLNVNFD
jgi:hypothetical protein